MAEDIMSGVGDKHYDPETYWANRYSEIDVTRSGHIDLPIAYNHWLYRRKKETLLNLLRRHGFEPKGSSVFEVATGSGVYVDFWRQQGIAKLVGIDLSEAASAAMRSRFPQFHFYKRDLAEPGLAGLVGTGFDLVTAVDVLYHIVDDQRFARSLKNMAAVIAPGGLLAIHDVLLNGETRDFGHMRLRDLSDYTGALERAGFEVLVRKPTFFSAVRWLKPQRPGFERLHDWVWSRVMWRLLARSAHATGAATYALDRMLARVLREGPSYEMMICRRQNK
jgi:SAM-dependent methyltransferase